MVEVDELQHSQKFSQSTAYTPQKEFQRMCDLSSALGKPVVIIRYNPDAFKIGGKSCRTSTIDRMPLLLERIQLAISAPPSTCITVEYLFYSRVQLSVGSPFIGRFLFLDQQCMTNWIDTIGCSWDVLTLGEAVEIAEDTTGIAQECVLLSQETQTKFDAGSSASVSFAETASDNLKMLFCNGRNFEEALDFMVKPNVNQLVIDAIRYTSNLILMVTGESNPFKLGQKIYSEQEISKRLQCQLVTVPCKSKKGTKEELCLSPAKKHEFIALIKTWNKCNPGLYKLYSMPDARPLTLLHAIHILDRVLSIMLDMHFTRNEKPIRQSRADNQRRVYTYRARESTKIMQSWRLTAP